MISRLLRAGVLAVLCVAALPEIASAQRAYDGNWSVLIVTQQGNCDRAYRYGVSIRSGSVNYDGGVVNFTGRVAANGAVRCASPPAAPLPTVRDGSTVTRARDAGPASPAAAAVPAIGPPNGADSALSKFGNITAGNRPIAGIRPCLFSQTQLRRPRTSGHATMVRILTRNRKR